LETNAAKPPVDPRPAVLRSSFSRRGTERHACELGVNGVDAGRQNDSLVLAAVAPNIWCGFDTNVDGQVDLGANDAMTSRISIWALALAALLLTSATPSLAAPCGSGTFESWLEDFKKEAATKGISQSAIQAGLTGIALDKSVLARDHSQKVFSQSFEEFSGRMVPPRLARGANMLKQYGSVLARIEQTYGVPGEVLVAIWGLETDFGVNIGKFPTLRSLATLAYDCRRADMFKAELMDALRIIERGDIAPAEMRGAWAGEIGQTQFMPSSYVKFAVDFDGNGRRDLLRSAPDVLASTANFLASYGWQRGKDWEPGSANFAVLQQWNKSEVYSKTIGYFATQLARAP
jgi:membrane-bound lytic murein transglycosylase B